VLSQNETFYSPFFLISSLTFVISWCFPPTTQWCIKMAVYHCRGFLNHACHYISVLPLKTALEYCSPNMVVRFAENTLNLSRPCTFKTPLYRYQLLCKFAAGQRVNRTSRVCLYMKMYTFGLCKAWFGQGVSPVQPDVEISFHDPSCFLTPPSSLFFSYHITALQLFANLVSIFI